MEEIVAKELEEVVDTGTLLLKSSPSSKTITTMPILVEPENIADIPEQAYKNTNITPYRYSSDDFFLAKSDSILIDKIQNIMENEAPISKALLCKKILTEWGISRWGPRLEARFETFFHTLKIYRTEHDGLAFLWTDENQCRTYENFRPLSGREATDLPPEEVANAIRQIMTDSISLPLTDLLKVCAQTFGFVRMGTNIDATMKRGIREAMKRNFVKMEGERVIIVN